MVVTEGLQHVLDVQFESGTQVTSWYVGLTDSSPTTAAGNTLSSHAGWAEESDYTGNRQLFNSARSSEQVDNSSNKASFAITTNFTAGGAFVASVQTGSAGTLFCVEAFTGGNKVLATGDTLEVTYTISTADS